MGYAVYPNSSQHPILIWENIDLFSNGNGYDIFADELESTKLSYLSIMIFDGKSQDALSSESTKVDTIANYFTTLAKTTIPLSIQVDSTNNAGKW